MVYEDAKHMDYVMALCSTISNASGLQVQQSLREYISQTLETKRSFRTVINFLKNNLRNRNCIGFNTMGYDQNSDCILFQKQNIKYS